MRSGNVVITSALALFAVAFGTLRLAADESSVTFYGGAGRVGGSCALVENGGKRVLVDCGTNYSDAAALSAAGRRGVEEGARVDSGVRPGPFAAYPPRNQGGTGRGTD